MRTASILIGLVLFAVLPSVAQADEVRKEGNVWLPQTIKKGERLPVLIVYQGGADETLVDLEALVRDHHVVIVHALQGSVFGREPGSSGIPAGIKVALSEASRVYPAIVHAPCVLGSFGKAKGLLNALTYAGFTRDFGLQGVVSVQPTVRTFRMRVDGGMTPALPQQPDLHALLLETEGDEKSTAAKIAADVASAGIKVVVERVEAKADLRRAAVTTRVAKFLQTCAKGWTGTRSVLPLLAQEGEFETVETVGADDLKLTGDLYRSDDKAAPVLLLFHQARSSRGEYRRIAPRLVAQGYNVLAIDQRSGDKWLGVVNKTAERASDLDLADAYVDAKPDLVRALTWARELGFTGRLGIVGSSYSSSLALILGAENEGISAVVSFSPANRLPPGDTVVEAAKKLKVATLVVCPPKEEQRAKEVFEPISAEDKQLYVQPEGVHGASTLYRSKTFPEAWRVLFTFLDKHLK